MVKFQNLRSYFRKEQKKNMFLKSGSGASFLKPKWEHFTRLQFLNDTFIPESSSSNLDNVEVILTIISLKIFLLHICKTGLQKPSVCWFYGVF